MSNSRTDLAGEVQRRCAGVFVQANQSWFNHARYDEWNRLASASPTSGGTEHYGYGPDNKRIYRWTAAGSEEWTFYGARGEKIGTFGLNTSGTYYFYATAGTDLWFAGQLIVNGSGWVTQDRVGSDAQSRFYPYGDEITSTPNDREKYATYFRDSFTTLDYADQRYYASSYGRFNTPDPMAASAMSGDPGSWNRYAYVGGDPVNAHDPSGMIEDVTDCAFGYGEGCGNDGGWGGGAGPVFYFGGDYPGFPNLCFTNPTWALAHQQACGIVPVAAPAQPAQPTGPTCSISLYERPVVVSGVTVGEHTYIDSTDSSGSDQYVNFLCEGGPSNPNGSGTLQGGCPSAFDAQATKGTSNPGLSSNTQVGSTYTGANACDDLVKLLASVDLYQQNGNFVPYSPYSWGKGYNSNSYTFTLLSDLAGC